MSAGDVVRILRGRLRNSRGQIAKIIGRHAEVRVAGSTVTLPLSELEAV